MALFVLSVLSFGLLIPWLGFYWDDWPVILITRLQGASGFWDFYQYDRPFSAWTYILFAPILGTRPVAWHIFALLLRWLTVVGMWWSLRSLWPRHIRTVTWMASLFAVYPIFNQQPISVAYSQHWISYALFFLSAGAMIQSMRAPRRAQLWTALSLFTTALHLLTMEYFLGLELMRPIFIWLVDSEKPGRLKQQLKSVLKRWWPYAAILLIYVLWRLFFLDLAGEDPNQPTLLFELFSQPLPALISLSQVVLRDVVYFLVGAWYQTLRPTQINLDKRSYLFSLGLSALSAGGLIFYLLRSDVNKLTDLLPSRRWIKQAILVGVLATVLGPLPAWLTGRQTIAGLYGSRFGLAAMFGASVLVVALLEWLTSRRVQKMILLSASIGLAVGFHFRTANDFRWIAVQQSRFYWQIHWRAPSLKPDTAILSDGELFPYVGTYSTGAALNLLYPQPSDASTLGYWFFDLDRDVYPRDVSRLDQGIDLEANFRSFSFSGSSRDSLVINYEPEEGRCLWVLSPSSAGKASLSERTQEAIPASNLNRIGAEPAADGYPPPLVFGKEPEHNWCYFFQKAELAREISDWQTIARLGNEVEKRDLEPGDPHEWWPFIEGYAHVGRWERAQELTFEAFRNDNGIVPNLCQLWGQIDSKYGPHPEAEAQIDQVENRLKCST